MNFWHMQLHPDDRKEVNRDEVLKIITEKQIIGLGKKWDNDRNQPYKFSDEMKVGDIVLVRSDGPFALVKVTSDCYGNEDKDVWFELKRSIKIISTAGDKFKNSFKKKYNINWNEAMYLPTTIELANNSRFINYWYNIIKEKEEMQDLKNILSYKKQIILQGPPGTGKTRLAEIIAKAMVRNNQYPNDQNETKKYNEKINLSPSIIRLLIAVGDKIQGKSNKQFEIISLDNKTISLKSKTSQAWSPSYNKIIKSYNEELFNVSGRTGGYKSYEDAIAMHLKTKINEADISKIVEIEDERDFIEFIQVIQFHPSYTYEDFVRGIIAKSVDNIITYSTEDKTLINIATAALQNPNNNYVLIIDEINRANLPSVLGELIYALEYRGKEVNSLYEIEGDSRIELPNNLYVIGTMNTADRSVGHIDYAIRRRFAFVDVLPEIEPVHPLVKDTFIKISALFIKDYQGGVNNASIENAKTLASDFRAEDVWLGHSYFISKNEDETDKENSEAEPILKMKMKYEVIPILKEYIKDGILLSNDEVKKVMTDLISKYGM